MKKQLLLLVLLCKSLFSMGQTLLLSPEELQEKPMYFQLERALEHPDKVYRLYLDKFQYEWEEAGQLFPGLVNLQSVVVVGEYFSELPDELLAFKMQLQEIVFQENAILDIAKVCQQLEAFPYLRKVGFVQTYGLSYAPDARMDLPKELARLQQIKVLDLSLNPLRSIPASVFELRNLQSLTLQSTELDSIPKQIAQLKSLTQLDLSCHPDARPNPLRRLPDALGKLTELRRLDLHQLESLAEMPDFIGKLKKLEELNMADCTKIKLEAALEVISNLTNLKRLNLMHLKGDKLLPKTIGKLRALEWLNLYGCALQELPKELANLSNLRYLNLRGNRIPNDAQKKWKESIQGIEF